MVVRVFKRHLRFFIDNCREKNCYAVKYKHLGLFENRQGYRKVVKAGNDE